MTTRRMRVPFLVAVALAALVVARPVPAFERAGEWSASDFDNTIAAGDGEVYLRIDRISDSVRFEVSNDGQRWQPLSKPIHLDLPTPRVAVGAIGHDRTARFDFLHFVPLESSSSAR